jgi:hypothetical protein
MRVGSCLHASVFTFGVGSGNSQNAFAGAHIRNLAAYIYLLDTDTPEQWNEAIPDAAKNFHDVLHAVLTFAV